MRIDNSLCGIDQLGENIPTQMAFFAFVTFRLSNYLINTLHSLVLTRGLSFPNEKVQVTVSMWACGSGTPQTIELFQRVCKFSSLILLYHKDSGKF